MPAETSEKTISRLQAELSETQEKFRQAEQRLASYFETPLLGFATSSPDGKWLTVNDKFCDMLGYSREEMVNQPWAFFTHPDDLPQNQKLFKETFENRRPGYTLDKRFVRKDGSTIFTAVSVRPIYNSRGKIEYLATLIEDITERKMAEEKLIRSEIRYRTFFEDSPISQWEEDFSQIYAFIQDLKKQGVTDFAQYFEQHPEEVDHCTKLLKVLDANQRTLDMYGAASKQELFSHLDQVFDINAHSIFHEELLQISQGATEINVTGRNRRLDGKIIDIHLHWRVARGSEDDYSRILVSILDVSEQRQAELKLQAAEKRFRTLVENQGEGIVLLDKNGVLVFSNPAAERIFQVAMGSLIGQNIGNFTSSKARDTILNLLQEPTNGNISVDTEITCPDGEMRNILLTVTPWYDQSGQRAGSLCVFRDITERKQSEAELEYRSTHDALTGLCNRLYYEQEILLLAQKKPYPISVMLADMDTLKRTNDTYGHAVGDELLRRTATVIHSCMRNEDVVARIGGDEFGILLPKTNADTANKIVQRIHKAIDLENERNPLVPICLSIGVATANDDETLQEAMARADKNMYREKVGKRNVTNIK